VSKQKSAMGQLRNQVNEASKDSAKEIEIEVENINGQFERQKEALTRKHASEVECLRQELRQLNEDRVMLITRNENL